MRSSLASLLGGSALIAALASCSVNPAAAVCNNVQLKSVAIPQLVYPTPDFTKVPDNAAFIVVAYPDAPSLAQTITLTQRGGSSQALGPLGAAPKQIPTPHAKVLPGQGTEYGVTLPKLAPHTTYTVAYRYANSANLCGQSTTTSTNMGSFSTL